jgi:endonuclease/exonuclease/phosphatase family metal-dependent hydrolase
MPDSLHPAARTPRSIKILTYNIHSCIGTDRVLDPGRIAEVIARADAHIIALQEVDVGRMRTKGIDQAHAIAEQLNMRSHFHAALTVAEEQYGDAILTALPTRFVKSGPLPSRGEMRGALWVEIDIGGQRINVVNTHLGLRGGERVMQARTLLGAEWLGHADCKALPTILCGDFNAVPRSAAYRLLAGGWGNVENQARPRAGATFPSRLPLLRLDHVFTSQQIDVEDVRVLRDRLSRVASDHLPLEATLRI